MGIDRVVAPVLHKAEASYADAHRLGQQRNQFRSNQRYSDDVDVAVHQTILQGGGFRHAFTQLYRAFFAARGECADIVRDIEQRGKLQAQF